MRPLALLLLACCWITPVSAQPAPTRTYLADVSVTAQKRPQSNGDVPMAVSVFSGHTANALGFVSSSDIASQVPNFNVALPTGPAGAPAMVIRGVGLDDFGVLSAPPVAVYVDGTYVAAQAAQTFPLLDLEQVEILRGPQTTLWGHNATGGVVHFRSRRPQSRFNGFARVSAGSFGATSFEGAAGGPLGRQLAARLAYTRQRSDGWLDNLESGHAHNGTDEHAGRFQVDWRPHADWSFLWKVEGSSTRADPFQFAHRGLLDESGSPCDTRAVGAGDCVDLFGYRDASGDREGRYDEERRHDTRVWHTAVTVTGAVEDNLAFTSVTAFTDVDDRRPEDADASPNALLANVHAVRQETLSQKFRLDRTGDFWRWTIGATFLADEAFDVGEHDALRIRRAEFAGNTTTCSAPPGNPTGLCPEAGVERLVRRNFRKTTSLALHADATWVLAEYLNASAGLRYTEEDLDARFTSLFAEPGAVFPRLDAKGNAFVDRYAKASDGVWSGRFVLDYHYRPNVLFYGGFNAGFKGPGAADTRDGPSAYAKETLIAFEGGAKATLASGRLRLGAAVFFYDHEDLQVVTSVNREGMPTPILGNAADANSSGAELELGWLPTPDLYLALAVGVLDAEISNSTSFVGTGPEGPEFQNLAGTRPTLAPELDLSALVQYDLDLGAGRLRLQADLSHQSEVFFDTTNDAALGDNGYTSINARVAWTLRHGRWELAAWARNLTDARYATHARKSAALGLETRALGTPRHFGLAVTYRP